MMPSERPLSCYQESITGSCNKNFRISNRPDFVGILLILLENPESPPIRDLDIPILHTQKVGQSRIWNWATAFTQLCCHCLRFSKPYLTSFLLIMTGIAGTVAACVWGAIAYKNRGPAMTTSRYLMRLRVIAQSCVVGSIMAGIGVTALQNKIEARSKKDQLWKKNCLLNHAWHCTYTVTTK